MDIYKTQNNSKDDWTLFFSLFLYTNFFSYIIKYGRGECFVIFLILWLMKQFRYLSDVLRLLVGGLPKKNNLPIVLQIFIGLVTYDLFVYMCALNIVE